MSLLPFQPSRFPDSIPEAVGEEEEHTPAAMQMRQEDGLHFPLLASFPFSLLLYAQSPARFGWSVCRVVVLCEVQVQIDGLIPVGFTAPRASQGFCLCQYLCSVPKVKVE